jgi:hypothetical protein
LLIYGNAHVIDKEGFVDRTKDIKSCLQLVVEKGLILIEGTCRKYDENMHEKKDVLGTNHNK